MKDFRTLLISSEKMSTITSSLKWIPGTKKFIEQLEKVSENVPKGGENITKQLKLIDAMTPEEKANPGLLQKRAFKERQRIIDAVPGTEMADLNNLLDQFKITQETMYKAYELKKLGKTLPNDMEGLLKMIRDNGGLSKEVNNLLRKKNK